MSTNTAYAELSTGIEIVWYSDLMVTRFALRGPVRNFSE